MKNAINWFEIPALNFTRATAFYQTVLGVTLQHHNMGGADMGFFPADHDGIGGAIVCGNDMQPASGGVLVYLNANPDLAAALGRVEAAGGSIVVPKTQISPEFGFFAIVADTEGNAVGLHSST